MSHKKDKIRNYDSYKPHYFSGFDQINPCSLNARHLCFWSEVPILICYIETIYTRYKVNRRYEIQRTSFIFFLHSRNNQNSHERRPRTSKYVIITVNYFIHTSSFLTRSRTIDFAPVENVAVSPTNIKTSPSPLCTIWHRTSFPAWLRMDALNRYKPGTGALKIPVKESNPLPIFVIILGNWTVWSIPIFIWWSVVTAVNPTLVMWEVTLVDSFVPISSRFRIPIKNK